MSKSLSKRKKVTNGYFKSQIPTFSPYIEYQSLLKSLTAFSMFGFAKICFNTDTGAVIVSAPLLNESLIC